MGCNVESVGAVTIFTCGLRRDPCASCGSPAVSKCCAWLRGKFAGQICDRPVCNRCAERVGAYVLCSAHARIARGR